MQLDGYMRASVTDDPRMTPSFYTRSVLNEAKSREEGKPVFEPKPYFRLERAGERDYLDREATEEDKAKYPELWRAHEEKRDPMPEGTPLAILFPQFPEVVATLEYHKVRTVEQLRALPDTAKQAIGLGAHEWRKKADEFLKAAEGAQGFHALKKAQEESQLTIQKLTEEISLLRGKLAEVEKGASAPPQEYGEMQKQINELMQMVTKPEEAKAKRKEKSDGDSN